MEVVFNKQREVFLTDFDTSFQGRRYRLIQLQKLIKENKTIILEALKNDLKKPKIEAYFSEIKFLEDELDYCLSNLNSWMTPQKVRSPLKLFPSKAAILHEPYGQVLILSPWNYPLQLALSPAIGALAAGNTVILKPSELTPHTGKILESLVEKYFKDTEFKVVLGDAHTAEVLLELPFDFIFFTGSTPVGKKVMAAAAKNLTPVCLELGGKSPALVDENTNIEFAARKIIWGKFFNAGQTCVAPDFVLAHINIYDKLLIALKKAITDFYSENPLSSEDYGRIVNARHFNRLLGLIDQSKVFCGGDNNLLDLYIAPTVLNNINWNDPIMNEEIFGPLLPVMEFQNWNDVVRKLKTQPKSLALYLFSNDQGVINKVINEISFGGGSINDCLLHLANENLPFGGVGPSGMGCYHGKYSFETFSHKKAILFKSQNFEWRETYPPYKLLKYLNLFK